MFANDQFTILKAPIEEISKISWEILEDLSHYRIKSFDKASLGDSFSLVQNSKYDRNKTIIWQPSNANYSVFYSNYLDGWHTMVYNINYRYHVEALDISLSEVHQKWGMSFRLYNESGERLVRALYDNRWTFFEKGSPASFENLEFYKNRKVVDRMNINILRQYLIKYGIDISDQHLYTTEKNFIYIQS